jgi:hypothetical protein
MIYRVLAYLLSLLLDFATLGRRDVRERELEILLLRHQLRILHRTQARRVRPSRWEKLTLAVLAAKLRQHTQGARAAWRQSPWCSSRRRPSSSGTASWSAASGHAAVVAWAGGHPSRPISKRSSSGWLRRTLPGATSCAVRKPGSRLIVRCDRRGAEPAMLQSAPIAHRVAAMGHAAIVVASVCSCSRRCRSGRPEIRPSALAGPCDLGAYHSKCSSS